MSSQVIVGIFCLTLALGVSKAQVQPNASGIMVTLRGLSKLVHRDANTGRYVLNHEASMPNPDTTKHADVLVFALYVPTDGELFVNATIGKLSPHATIQRTGSYGGRSVAHLVVDPFDGTSLIDSCTLSISWEGTLVKQTALLPPISAPFLNAAWGSPGSSRKFTRVESSQQNVDPRTWYRKNGSYVRIETYRDGVARIPVERVLENGKFDSLNTIALYWRGIEQPLFIRDNDSSRTLTLGDDIIFRGRRPSGDSTWLDDNDSTSVYYLTGSQSEGARRRYTLDTSSSKSSVEIRSVVVRERFERDTGYYHPGSGIDNDRSIFLTSTALYEGFYWKNLYGRSKERGFFPIRFTPADSGYVTIAADVVTTTDSKKYAPEHIVDFHVPDSSTTRSSSPVTASFEGYERRQISLTLPCAGMPSGEFNVSVTATGSDELRANTDWYSEVLVDGFTIEGAASPVLDSGRLRCSYKAAEAASLAIYNITSDSLVVIDTLDNTIRLLPRSEQGTTIRVSFTPVVSPFSAWDGRTYSIHVCMGALENESVASTSFVVFHADGTANTITKYVCSSPSECMSVLQQISNNASVVVVNTGATFTEDLRKEFLRRGLGSSAFPQGGTWSAIMGEGKGMVSSNAGAMMYIPSNDGTDGMAFVPVEPGEHSAMLASFDVMETAHLLPAKNHAIAFDDRESDIIAIAHSTHLSQATRWAAHRFATSGKTVTLYDVDAVFEEFDAGRHTPNAIKAFLVDRWSKARKKPTHCVLIGNASWDVRNAVKAGNVSASRTDQVPTYGKPSSDMWYGLLEDENDLATPELIVSRFPVTTEEECRNLVDKIITADTTAFAPYQRKFMYVGGGKENENFCDIYERLLNDFSGSELVFTQPPLCLDTVTVCALNSPNPGADIKRNLQDGVSWMNYIGHGGTDVFDIAGWEPEDLTNSGRYPVLATFSCLTGNYASPSSLCENAAYLVTDSRGMVASIGATGYQYIAVVDLLHYRFHEAMLKKKMRNVGELTYEAKRAFALMRDQFGTNATLQYCLLGDPFTRVRIDTIPEISVVPSSIQISSIDGDRTVFLQQDSFFVDVEVWNQGLATNTAFDVQVIHCTSDLQAPCDTIVYTVQPDMCSRQSTRVVFPTRSVGRHTVTVALDVFHSISDNPQNDTAAVTFNVDNRSFLIVEPDEYALVDRNDIHVRVLSPYLPSLNASDSARIEFYANLDDMKVGKSLPSRVALTRRRGAVTDFTVIVDTSAQIMSDSLPVYLTVESASSPMIARTIVLGKQAGNPTLHHVPASEIAATERLVYQAETKSYRVASRPIPVSIQSSGTVTADPVKIPAVRFSLADSVYFQSSYRNGLNIVVLRPFSTIPRLIRRYDTSPTPAPRETGHYGSAPECIEFLRDSVRDHEIVVIAACTESFTQFVKTNLFDSLRNELKKFGSKQADMLSSGSSYVFVGSRSWTDQSSIERVQAASGLPVRIDTALQIRFDSASIETFVVENPSKVDSVNFTPADSSLRGFVTQEFDGGGVRTDTVIGKWSATESMPRIIKLTVTSALLPRDSNSEPSYKSVSVWYQPAPLVYLDSTMLSYDPGDLVRGDSVAVKARLWNLHTNWKVDSASVEIALVNSNDPASAVSSTVYTGTIEADQEVRNVSSMLLPASWSSAYARCMVTSPSRERSLYPLYQSATTQLQISEDTLSPMIDVYIDGKVARPRSFVRDTTSVEIRVFDKALLPITSVDKLVVFVNGQRIRQSTALEFEFLPTTDAQLQYPDPDIRAVMRFRFAMEPGENLLIVRARDASNNADTLELPLIFETEDQIRDVVVGPNPSAGETFFRIHVSGERGQLSANLTLYDLQGRSLLSVNESLTVGWNLLRWDGLTPLGDSPVLGLYVWHLTLLDGAGSPVGKGLSGPVMIAR